MALIQKETSLEQSSTRATQKSVETRLPIVSLILWVITMLGMAVTIWMAFLYAPTDAIQGPPQRIFYFHVPIAWIGMLAFVVMAGAGVAYLWKKDERWDWLARASAEIGVVFISLALITGSIWGKTTWGTWWTWDARLTTTLILW
ncbi:MAG: cytochrome c biogenesis protein CcsA, partial [Ktedonobacteraceae bacterium]